MDPDTAQFVKEEDLLLPWSCCIPDFQSPGLVLEQPPLANTIRGRLKAKGEKDGDDGEQEALPAFFTTTDPPTTRPPLQVKIIRAFMTSLNEAWKPTKI